METSRKRFNENDGECNKRKSRKSRKSKSTLADENADSSEESVDFSMDCQDLDNAVLNKSSSSAVTLQMIQTCSKPYSSEDDKKIIKYFKANMNLLNRKDDVAVFHLLKEKFLFQKSAKSLQLRFLNVILPNLLKYDVLSDADLIDFYDAAKLQVPEEFIKRVYEKEETSKNKNSTQKSASEQSKEVVAESNALENKNTSTQNSASEQFDSKTKEVVAESSALKNKNTSTQKSTSKQSDSKTSASENKNTSTQKNTSKQSNSKTSASENISNDQEERNKQTEVDCAQSIVPEEINKQTEVDCTQSIVPEEIHKEPEVDSAQSSVREDMCLKSILGFILLNNSKGDCVLIPDTESDIPSIKKRLLDEFQIQQECIKIIPKSTFDVINKIKTFDRINELVNDVVTNRIHDENLVEKMLPDAKKLLELMEKCKVTNSPQSQANEILNDNQIPLVENEIDCGIFSTCSEIAVDNIGELINTLSDSLENASLTPNIGNDKCNGDNNNPVEIKREPVDLDDVETIVRSHYFPDDHSYCRSDGTNSETNTPNKNSVANDSNLGSTSPTDRLIDGACIPQIMFSQRCKNKIEKENINIDHLLMKCADKDDETLTSKLNNSDENKSNDT